MSCFFELDEEEHWNPRENYKPRVLIKEMNTDDRNLEIRSFPNDEWPDRKIDLMHSDFAVSDPLAYYVPYHWDQKNWGIYFRIDKMLKDFNGFINKYYQNYYSRNAVIWEGKLKR